MSDSNQIKCIHCGSENIFPCLANEEPAKVAFRCRECTSSWKNS